MTIRTVLEIAGCVVVIAVLFASLPVVKEYLHPGKPEKVYVQVPVPAPRWVEYEWCQTSINNSRICKIKGE